MEKITAFFKESWSELKQVSWLTVPQMIASTWFVVILVILMALYVGGIDLVLSKIIGVLI